MMGDREQILHQIRRSLATNREMLEREAARNGYHDPEPSGPFMPTDLTPLAQFQAELEALKGHVHLCPTPADALAAVRHILVSHDVESALCWEPAEIPLPGVESVLQELNIHSADPQLGGFENRLERLQGLDPVQIGISGADAAIAESGTIVVVSGPGRARMASLLPPVHLAILPAERIVRSLPEAFALLTAHFGADVVYQRSNISLISGPSRTGDIEQSLTLGVHGPKEIHVVVVG